MKTPACLFPLCLMLLLSAGRLTAAEGGGGGGEDARMRTALRDLTQQLRTAQTDLAAAQGAQATLAAENKDLAEKYEAVRKQAAADRAAGEKTTGGLSAQVTDLKAQVARLTAALEAAKAGGEKASVAARTAETERIRLAGELAELQQQLADREAKNLALFMLGNQILTRYEEFSLGNALRAKEPFVGRARTRLENLVQDYGDKLSEQRVSK